MGEIRIFEKEKDRLFSACFEPEQKDELDKVLDAWRDVEGIRAFFNHYREDLTKFEPTMKVRQAVRQVRDEADGIYDRLIEFSEQNKLDELFKPLDDREADFPPYEFQKLKAKEGRPKNMLRLYAVKFRDWYVITGGAIKLTDQMKGRPHLKAELNKLELVREFLQEGNPEGSFVYLDIQ